MITPRNHSPAGPAPCARYHTTDNATGTVSQGGSKAQPELLCQRPAHPLRHQGRQVALASFDNIPVSLLLRNAATDMLPIRLRQDPEGRLDVHAGDGAADRPFQEDRVISTMPGADCTAPGPEFVA